MRFPEFTALACMGLLFMISMPRCVTPVSHVCITLFVRNLPCSVEDVRQTVRNCSVCSEFKPNFYKPPTAQLVKSTQRLSLYFKGPLPSSTKNRYVLTVIDEFSRFPFAFPYSSVDAKTVISCLNRLFALFGMPAYIHSDKGTAFMSHAFNVLFAQPRCCLQQNVGL